MEFRIIIDHNRQKIRLTVKRVFQDARKEQYEVIARNGILTLETNWPIFKNRGLKRRKPDWKLLSGQITYSPVYQLIIEAIERKVADLEGLGRKGQIQ